MLKQFKIICYISLVIMLLLVANSFFADVLFRFEHMNAKVNSISTSKLSTEKDPLQIDLVDSEKNSIKHLSYKYKVFILKPQAKYSITALIVAKNTNFFLRDILRTDFDEVCVMDYGLVWGEISTKKYINTHLKFKSNKTLGNARQLVYRAKKNHTLPHNWNYINSHVSHTHLIPANKNITKALLKARKFDVVKLDGYLVDIYKENGETIALTSLSRYDKNSTSRGSGACEDMYVTQVQIGNKIYK